MKGFTKGSNFSTSANGQFTGLKSNFATGGVVGKIKAAAQGPAKKPGLLGAAPKGGGMLGAVKGALQAAAQKRQAPAAAPAPGSPPAKPASPSLPIKMSRPGVKRAFADGGKVETKEQFKAKEMKRQDPPRPKQSLARAADRQDFADLNGGDEARETIRVGNTKKSYKDVKDAQSKRDNERMGVKGFATGGKVEAGAGSGVFRSQVQEHGYAKGGEVKLQTIAERQVAKHVAAPAPKGHKGLKA